MKSKGPKTSYLMFNLTNEYYQFARVANDYLGNFLTSLKRLFKYHDTPVFFH